MTRSFENSQGEPTAYCRLLLFLQAIVYHRCKPLSRAKQRFLQQNLTRASFDTTACQKITFLVYGMCRGDHRSPANLAQHRVFRGQFSYKENGHGRAMLAPTNHHTILRLPSGRGRGIPRPCVICLYNKARSNRKAARRGQDPSLHYCPEMGFLTN